MCCRFPELPNPDFYARHRLLLLKLPLKMKAPFSQTADVGVSLMPVLELEACDFALSTAKSFR